MKVPERTCVICKTVIEKKNLLRIVKTPDGEIVLDSNGRLNGRGAYICKNELCFERLKKMKALDRSFKISVSAETYESLMEEAKRLIEG